MGYITKVPSALALAGLLLLLMGCEGPSIPSNSTEASIRFVTIFADVDLDGDGVKGALDCDDQDPHRSPELQEIPYDGVDQDCEGTDLIDQDNDGYPSVEAGGDDCNDNDTAIHPGITDIYNDGIDQDCNGTDSRDLDGDGYSLDDGQEGADCNDADPSVSPDAQEIQDAQDNDCDGLTDEVPYSGALSLDQSTRWRAGGRAWLLSGSSLTLLPDLTRDTLPELLVGELGGSRLLVFSGSASLWQDPSAWFPWVTFQGTDGEGLGASLPAVADLNADGWSELLMGAAQANGGRGKVLVVGGEPWPAGASLDLSQVAVVLEGEAPEDALGTAALGGPDLDGDGFPDAFLGAPGADPQGIQDAGAVYWYRGRVASSRQSASIQAVADGFILGSTAQGASGKALASGDFNGDGYSDLAIGAPGGNSGLQAVAGQVALFYGGRVWAGTRTWHDADLVLRDEGSGAASAQAGLTLEARCDLNGDGYADLFIGAPFAGSEGIPRRGRVYWMPGSASGLQGTQPLAAVEGSVWGETEGDEAGSALACAGDLNGDGFDDLFIGAPGALEQRGAVYLLYGGPYGCPTEGVLGQGSTRISESSPGALLGLSVVGGDFDGDGLGEGVFGAPGYTGTGGDMEGRVAVLPGLER